MNVLNRMSWSRIGLGLLVAFVASQLIPVRPRPTNPPVTGEPAWDAPETRVLARQACFDCHSNETAWPAYASIAPVSWLVQHDVDEGRAALNFSEWTRPQEEAKRLPKKSSRATCHLECTKLMHSQRPIERVGQ
jgi:mono/diheme cytochrome c family protein